MIRKMCMAFLIAMLVPAIASAQCTDSDGQDNFKVKGTVTGLDIHNLVGQGANKVVTVQDKCSNEKSLNEYNCHVTESYLQGYIVSTGMPCLKCVDGTCPDTCTDSDGKDYFKDGALTMEAKDKSSKQVYEDSCREYTCDEPIVPPGMCQARSNEKVYVLQEWYCGENGFAKTEMVKCENGCAGKACSSSAILESVAVLQKEIAALKQDIASLKAELALLKEKVAALEAKAGNVPAQPGTAASSVSIGTCVDSDGESAAVKGTTAGMVLSTKKQATFSDECIGSNKLKEYYCAKGSAYGGYLNYKIKTCAGSCSEGKCI